VLVEHQAGADCHWADEDYQEVQAGIVFSTDEVYRRADLVCRVGTMGDDDVESVRPESTVCGFLHLAVASRERIKRLLEKGVTLIGYEIIEREGQRPILMAISEIAGQLSVHTAAHLLKHSSGGRGLLLGGVPGIPAPTVLVLGAGVAGQAAARLSLACGAHAIILDVDIEHLRFAHRGVGPHLTTAVASTRNLKRFTKIADVLIGAVLTPGAKSPFVVTEDMVKNMRPGSVIIDLSIDQGGCIETSRPTLLDNPIFKLHDVIHYCVPNLTAAVPRTASRALTIAALPYLQRLVNQGVERALAEDAGLARGVYIHRGKVVNEYVARLVGEKPTPWSELTS
jgi:alanine dehydrogenase